MKETRKRRFLYLLMAVCLLAAAMFSYGKVDALAEAAEAEENEAEAEETDAEAEETDAAEIEADEVDEKLIMYGSIGRGYSQKSNYSTDLYNETRMKVLDFVGADEKIYTCFYSNNTTDGHRIAKLAHQYGAIIVVDGAQIVAHRSFSMMGET